MNILGYNIKVEKRGIDANHNAFVSTPYSLDSLLGSALNPNQRNATSQSAVYRCMNLIADAIAQMPINVKDREGNKVDHDVLMLFNDKFSLFSRYNLIKQLILSVIRNGNAYMYIERDGKGKPTRLQLLESQEVTIEYDKRKQAIYYTAPTVSPRKIEAVNMLHFYCYSNDGVKGVSLLATMGDTLKTAKLAEMSAQSYFEKGGNLAGFLTPNAPQNPEQRRDTAAAWTSHYQQGGNGVAVLPYGFSYTPLSSNASDLQLLDSRAFSVREIARFFGVPLSMVSDNTGSTYGSTEAELTAFVSHTLQPYVEMLECELNRKLLTFDATHRIDLEEKALIKADKTTQANYYNTLVVNGILTRNEARKALGYAPIEGADALTISYSDVAQNTINKENQELTDDDRQ